MVDAEVSAAELPPRADVVVIGSGFAGMSAAVELVSRGRRVVVVEEAPRLGGRASSFVDRETGERVDNGQHALFGCYTETFRFLKQIGAVQLAPLQKRLSVTMADSRGHQATLNCPDLPAPWHLVAGLAGWRAIGLADRLSALRLGGFLRKVRRTGAEAAAQAVPESQTVADWLRTSGQSPALNKWLWHPVAIAALNQQPDRAAARPFARVLGELFASDPAASAISLPSVPLDDLFAEPSAAFIAARGGVVIRRTPARVVVNPEGRLVGVRAGAKLIEAEAVISAVPWHAFERLWEEGVPQPLRPLADRAAGFQGSPIVTVNLWIDADAAELDRLLPPALGLVDGPMHWVFHRGRISGAGSTHLSIVASGAEEILRRENQQLSSDAFVQLQAAVPALRGRRVRHAVVVREPRATFSLAPGSPARPGPVTEVPGFFLAGDWTDTGLPATIEGAVRSGHAASKLA